VLDHVERGRVFEQPAGEHPPPRRIGTRLARLEHQHLGKSAGFHWHFPGRGALTALHADDNIADPLLRADLDDEIAGDVVALVEQAQGGDAIGVGRGLAAIGLLELRFLRDLCHLFGDRSRARLIARCLIAASAK
jgi:hypothetical protein